MCPKGVASRPATLLITNSPRLVPLLCVSSLPSSTEFPVIRGTTLQHGCRARSESIVTQVFMEASFPHGPLSPPQPQLNTTPAIGLPVPVQHLLGQPAEVGKMRAGRFRSAPRALTPTALSSRLPESSGRITFKRASHGAPCVPGTKLRPSGPAIFLFRLCPQDAAWAPVHPKRGPSSSRAPTLSPRAPLR